MSYAIGMESIIPMANLLSKIRDLLSDLVRNKLVLLRIEKSASIVTSALLLVLKNYVDYEVNMSKYKNGLEFYRSLCKEFNGDENKTSQCIVSEELIAERLTLSMSYVCCMRDLMFKYGITERQGGGIVI